VDFLNFSIYKILSRDLSILDKARIRLLYYGFLLIFVALGALFLSVYLQGLPLLTATSGILMFCVAALFKYLTFKPHWRNISHILLILGTIVNLSTVFVIMQDVNIIVIQIIILVVVFSFYMLGLTGACFIRC
jgi:hypothetical protein